MNSSGIFLIGKLGIDKDYLYKDQDTSMSSFVYNWDKVFWIVALHLDV